MKLAFTLAVTALLALTTTQADATLIITYDDSNRPISVSGLPVSVAPLLVDIIIDYSGLSFNVQFDDAQPPGGSPGGSTWGNQTFALALVESLRDAMNLDSTPPATVDTVIHFPYSTSDTEASAGITSATTPAAWVSGNSVFSRTGSDVSVGWATVSAVPEPSAFLCVGLVGLGFAGWKRRTANRDPS